jgi:hypothetical protein
VSDLQTLPKPSLRNESDDGTALRYPGIGKLFLIWTAIGLLTSLRYQSQRPVNAEVGEVAFIAAFTALYYPWIALTPVVFRLEKRFPLGHGNWLRNDPVINILGIIAPTLLCAGSSARLSFPRLR